MEAISSVSCIQFEEAPENATAYVNITTHAKGCFSSIGFLNTVQKFNLELSEIDSGCFRLGTIIHELLHTLGFYHQHTSPERDRYIQVIEENIMEDKKYNFDILSERIATNFGVEYDYGSIMHYSSKAFSKNGKETIIPRGDENIEIGQRRELSQSDIRKLNLMYGCEE